MNLQEREQLTKFLQQLAQVQPGFKDDEAQALIAGAFARQPDAPYLVVQRALLLDAALQSADAQITQLKAQLAQQRPATPSPGFLDATSWGRSASPASSVNPVSPITPASQFGQSAAMSNPALQAGAAAAPSTGFRAPGFLSNLATTAAGVAAGAFLFQGINHLVGGNQNAASPDKSALASPTPATEAPAANTLLDAPADAGTGIADSGPGFDELLDIGPDDSSDWT